MDITQANTSLPGRGHFSGTSVRASYSKSLPQTGTNLAIAAYRYSTGGYFALNDATRAREQGAHTPSVDTVMRQRSQASITLGQRMGEKAGRLSLTGSAVNYWNRSGSDLNFAVAYNNSYRAINYSVSATRQHRSSGGSDTLYYASVMMPLGKAHPMTATGSVSYGNNGRAQAQTNLSGSVGVDNSLSYGVTAIHASGGQSGSSTSGSTNALYRGRYAELAGSAGVGKGYSQGSVGVRGAVVAHPGGVTLSQPVSETFGIVEAPDAKGARVVNSPGVRIDSRGYAVVPYLSPYSMNTVILDPKGMSTDVELQVTSQQIAPHAGSVPLLKYATVSGRTGLIRARQSDGTPLPFGATVVDEIGKDVGVVSQASRIFARGLQDKGQLTVKWGDDTNSVCHIAYELPVWNQAEKSTEYQQIDATCTTSGNAPSLRADVADRAAGT